MEPAKNAYCARLRSRFLPASALCSLVHLSLFLSAIISLRYSNDFPQPVAVGSCSLATVLQHTAFFVVFYFHMQPVLFHAHTLAQPPHRRLAPYCGRSSRRSSVPFCFRSHPFARYITVSLTNQHFNRSSFVVDAFALPRRRCRRRLRIASSEKRSVRGGAALQPAPRVHLHFRSISLPGSFVFMCRSAPISGVAPRTKQ